MSPPSFGTLEGFQTLLFDIEKDPQEKNNVADEHPDIVKDLLYDVDLYEKDIHAFFMSLENLLCAVSPKLLSL